MNGTIRDLHCTPDSLAGPIDPAVVTRLRGSYAFSNFFVVQMALCHGGIPRIGTFTVGETEDRIGRFLTLLDEDSELTGPPRPHFEQGIDERAVNAIPYLARDGECYKFFFSYLMPFATVREGWDMCLDRNYVDFVCLDFHANREVPTVVLWNSSKVFDAYQEWDALPEDQQFNEEDECDNVPWDKFVIPLADTFEAFISGLRENPA